MPQAYISMYVFMCPELVALCVHNAHAPIIIELDCFLQPFVIKVLGGL